MVKRLWRTSPELIATSGLMMAVLAGALVGLVVDPRTITGVPAWLKPAKFAASIAIYTVTLAWIFTHILEWTRTRRVVGRTTAATLLLEIVIIAAQAWRGTPSHFNVATTFDAVLFAIMGIAIVVQTLSAAAVAVALWRHRFEDAALAWALRLGVSVTIIGAMTGGLMTQPTAEQLAAARAGERMNIAGAHTVGAPDGGPGLVGTGWSTEHGDLRVPHFVGLHAMQALPFVAFLLGRARLSAAVRTRLVVVAAVSHVGLYAILLAQALRGVPLIAPDATMMAQLATWALGTLAAAGVASFRTAPAHNTAAI